MEIDIQSLWNEAKEVFTSPYFQTIADKFLWAYGISSAWIAGRAFINYRAAVDGHGNRLVDGLGPEQARTLAWTLDLAGKDQRTSRDFVYTGKDGHKIELRQVPDRSGFIALLEDEENKKVWAVFTRTPEALDAVLSARTWPKTSRAVRQALKQIEAIHSWNVESIERENPVLVQAWMRGVIEPYLINREIARTVWKNLDAQPAAGGDSRSYHSGFFNAWLDREIDHEDGNTHHQATYSLRSGGREVTSTDSFASGTSVEQRESGVHRSFLKALAGHEKNPDAGYFSTKALLSGIVTRARRDFVEQLSGSYGEVAEGVRRLKLKSLGIGILRGALLVTSGAVRILPAAVGRGLGKALRGRETPASMKGWELNIDRSSPQWKFPLREPPPNARDLEVISPHGKKDGPMLAYDPVIALAERIGFAPERTLMQGPDVAKDFDGVFIGDHGIDVYRKGAFAYLVLDPKQHESTLKAHKNGIDEAFIGMFRSGQTVLRIGPNGLESLTADQVLSQGRMKAEIPANGWIVERSYKDAGAVPERAGLVARLEGVPPAAGAVLG